MRPNDQPAERTESSSVKVQIMETNFIHIKILFLFIFL